LGTLKNILATLRAVLSHAFEAELIASNPAVRLGRFVFRDVRKREADFLTRGEVESFLTAVRVHRPDRYALFLTAVRTGLRVGELLALHWDDIQFAEDEDDSNRFILVRHNYTHGHFTTPKNHKTRRVDMSKELRRILLERRDAAMLKMFERGEGNLLPLVFPSETGGPLDGVNVYHRDLLPCLQAAGLRRVTFHALRHSYASLLIQAGANLAYVKEQLGHSSIQVTVDTYGHLIPGANISWSDQLDMPAVKSSRATTSQQSATQAQPAVKERTMNESQLIEIVGGPARIRTLDQRIMSPLL